MRTIAAVVLVLVVGATICCMWLYPCSLLTQIVRGLVLQDGGVTDSGPMYVFRVSDPWGIPQLTASGGWSDVQTGRYVVVPELNTVLVSRPSWDDRPDHGLNSLRERGAIPSSSLTLSVPSFIVAQSGGGAGGLSRQVLVTEDGEVMVWGIPFDWNTWEAMPTARVAHISESATAALFDRALRVELPMGQSELHYFCEAIDGATKSITLFDGEQAGRLHYINGRKPDKERDELINQVLSLGGPG